MLRDSETRLRPSWLLLGPAFVAAIAYVDPGNVAANISAGAKYGFLLVWVIFLANAMAGLVQYLSAKLGLVSGRTLPEAVADHTRTPTRIAFWLQAELVAMATDLAEVVGGAIALHLLFDLPLLAGGIITGAVSLLLLAVQNRRGQRVFERLISGLLLIIAIGFLTSLFVEPPPLAAAAEGLAPRFEGAESVLLATAMLVAGAVNLSMVLVAATNLQGRDNTDSIEGAHAAVRDTLGPTVALFFAIGLLASGLASTSVGAYAGAMIMQGLLHRSYPLLIRRLVTLIPALVILAIGLDPSRALVISQVVLSFGIPFALIPLVRLTSNRALMGVDTNHRLTTALGWLVAAMITALNVVLIYLTLSS